MKLRKVLRIISLIMFVVAVVFLYTAVSAPTLGLVFYIGDFRVGQEEMRAFYSMYLIVMISLFVGSFFVPQKQWLG